MSAFGVEINNEPSRSVDDSKDGTGGVENRVNTAGECGFIEAEVKILQVSRGRGQRWLSSRDQNHVDVGCGSVESCDVRPKRTHSEARVE